MWSKYEESRSQCMFIWLDRPSLVSRKEHSPGSEFEIYLAVRSSHWRCSAKKDVFPRFCKIHRKTPVLGSVSFLIKLYAGLHFYLKRDSVTHVFSWTPFLQNTFRRLLLSCWWNLIRKYTFWLLRKYIKSCSYIKSWIN